MAWQLQKRLFAKFYDTLQARYEAELAPRKREFFQQLEGTVLELGPGTGANLELLPDGVKWVGVEPNVHMHSFLREKADRHGVEVDLLPLGDGGRLPLGDGSADAVLSTLVLCSVPDPAATLAEIRRVLRPGGRFLFWEHVVAPPGTGLRRFQGIVNPFQKLFADGCNANRDLVADVHAADFSSVDLETFDAPPGSLPPWLRPHVAGVAVA